MASDAHDRARHRMEQPSEVLLAELITREAALRQEAAAGQASLMQNLFTHCNNLLWKATQACLPAEHGLTALLRKPLQRERPNERFLQGTLRSVAFGEGHLARQVCALPALRASTVQKYSWVGLAGSAVAKQQCLLCCPYLSQGRAHALALYTGLTCLWNQPTGVTRRTRCGARGAGSWASTTSAETQARAPPSFMVMDAKAVSTNAIPTLACQKDSHSGRVCCF